MLEQAEPQIEAGTQHCVDFLCHKGKVCLLVGNIGAAQEALEQAQTIIDELGVGPQSSPAKAVEELRTLVKEDSTSGHALS